MKRWLVIGRLARTNRSTKSGAGYTILEVMTVLGIVTVMFFTISLTFRGRQAAVEFTQAVRAYEAKLQNTMTEISNGYYETRNECRASTPTDPPGIYDTPATAGTNEDCIFMGKVIASGELQSKIVTVAGRRTITDTSTGRVRDVESLDEAAPILVPENPTGGPDGYTNSFAHNYQLRVTRVMRLDSDTPVDVAAFAFLTPLSGAISSNRLTQLYGFPGSVIPPNPNQTVDPSTLSGFTPLPQGIKICVQGQNGQRAEILIGAGSGQTTITSVLDTEAAGGCP